MANNVINIASDDFILLSNKLDRIGRAELPVAVRSTLNNLAYDMKKNEIEKSADKEFDYKRNRTLFRAMTGFSKAKGLNVSRMQSESGIINRSGKNKLAEGLADQQRGGKTKQKATPLNEARVGRNPGRKVRQKYLLSRIDNAVKIKKQRGRRFTQLALRAERSGRPVLITGSKGDNFLADVDSFDRLSNGGIKFNLIWRYRINRDGKVNLSEKHPFINRAAKMTGRKMSKEFVNQANERITKAFKK